MSRPWMPFYVADYLADTAHITTLQHGAYVLLLLSYWKRGALPNDEQQLMQIARMNADEWKANRSVISNFFENGWKHGRMEKELAKSADISSKRAKAAKQKHSNSPAFAQQKHTQSPSPSQSQSPKVDDDGESIRHRAFSIATEIAKNCGYPTPQDWPPGFCGGPNRVETWLREGWPEETIMVGVRESLARKKDGPPSTMNYFEKAIARAVALAAAPLPQVQIIEGETIGAHRARNGASGDVIAAADRLIERVRGFQEGGGEIAAIENRSRESEAPVRMLPKG
jgi:uncharacterized protein YdaU (DUF1376 family)